MKIFEEESVDRLHRIKCRIWTQETIAEIDNGDVTIASSSIIAYPDGWYLATITGQFGSAGQNQHRTILYMDRDRWEIGRVSYNGDNASYIYIWGAKMTQSSSYAYQPGDGSYSSRGFQFESINYTLSNVMDDCTLRIDNLDSTLTSIFVDGTVEEETSFSLFRIIRCERCACRYGSFVYW